MSELAAGRLLVATPLLVDPNFERKVVLLLDVDQSGALGVVLNRPSVVGVETILPEWADRAPAPPVLFQGGPVATDSALAVAHVPSSEDPVGFRRVFGTTGIIDLDTPSELLTDVVACVRIFAGYAGWGPGQLEGEIAEGSWYVVDSIESDIFSGAPGQLWPVVLRRQEGELAWVSTMPADPTHN